MSTARPSADRRRKSRGQILVIFVFSVVVFLGLTALVVDVAWYWANSLRMQRAADAAALAGVVHLPGSPSTAISVARAEATKNGYTSGVNGYVVTPTQDTTNPRRLKVKITGPVSTYFAHVFGINSFPASRQSKAEFTLPVPMGSPEAYYGTFGMIRTPNGGITTPGDTGWQTPAALANPTGFWTIPPTPAETWRLEDNVYITRNSTTNPDQGFGTFGIPAIPVGATVAGIEVSIEGYSSDAAGCRLGVEISRNGGSGWTSTGQVVNLTGIDDFYAVPASGAATYKWGLTGWNSGHLSDANLRLRVQYQDPGPPCTNASTAFVDRVRIKVHYTTFAPDQPLRDPYGGGVNARGFWGTMHNPGSEDINGDAYLARYETRTSTLNPDFQPSRYYDYAVEIPSDGTGGEIWIYDPVFCAVGGPEFGTGDRWFSGTAPTSAFYTLFDTANTPWDLGDDTQVASSGNLFRGIAASDQTMNGPTGVSSCAQGDVSSTLDGRYWHNRWWQLASGLSGGTYRVRTSSTDPSYNNSDGHNSFAIWARASTTGAVKVYGVGAMEAFTPLDGGTASLFYLAQIDAVHAGKTVVIKLWDPGDTGNLTADLRILIPTGSGYQTATMSWTSAWGTSNSNRASCNGLSQSNVTSIRTNNAGAKVFNGCWLEIHIPIPNDYTAPQPSGEPEPGWWKIQYDMAGSSSDNSFDLTTWTVEVRGNPVHLVVP